MRGDVQLAQRSRRRWVSCLTATAAIIRLAAGIDLIVAAVAVAVAIAIAASKRKPLAERI